MDVNNAKATGSTSNSFSDVALVEALRNHDEGVFMRLIDQYQSIMVRMAQRHVDDRETAKEVVQETWLAVLRGISHFGGRASFKTWLFTILINRARTRGKQTKRLVPLAEWEQEQVSDEEASLWTEQRQPIEERLGNMTSTRPVRNTPEEQMLRQEVQKRIEQAILLLPPAQREVITLYDIEGWTAEEICLVLGLSEGNQRVLLHRARTKVRHALEGYLQG
ncbi:MAG: sigma-70 family RNA polymerase sigma factor [Caldilineaceae bacterium]